MLFILTVPDTSGVALPCSQSLPCQVLPVCVFSLQPLLAREIDKARPGGDEGWLWCRCLVLGSPDLDAIHNGTGIAFSPKGQTLITCLRVCSHYPESTVLWQGLEEENSFWDVAYSFLYSEPLAGLAFPGAPTSKSWSAPHVHLWKFLSAWLRTEPLLFLDDDTTELSGEHGWWNSLLLAISNPGSSQRVGVGGREHSQKKKCQDPVISSQHDTKVRNLPQPFICRHFCFSENDANNLEISEKSRVHNAVCVDGCS